MSEENGTSRFTFRTADAGKTLVQDQNDIGPLNVTSTNVEKYKESLKNKEGTELSEAQLNGTATIPLNLKDFYDYYVSGKDISNLNGLLKSELEMRVNIVIQQLNQKKLNSILFEADKISLSGKIDAQGLNIVLRGKQITVDECEFIGANVILEAVDTDKAFNVSYEGHKTLDIPDTGLLGKMEVNLLDAAANASVHVGQNARLTADEDITILAKTEQTNPLIIDNALSFVTVKVGNALVTVEGTLAAGGETEISADKTVEQKANNSFLTQHTPVPIPLAISWITGGAQVLVQKQASITAEKINLTGRSQIVVESSAYASDKMPVSIAASVVSTTAKCIVEDDAVLSGTAYVKLGAQGDMTVKTTAGQGPNAEGNKGGYFTVAVVNQDVLAAIQGNSKVTSEEGVVEVKSEAAQKVYTKSAVADISDGEEPEKNPTLSGFVDFLKQTVNNIASASHLGLQYDPATQSILSQINGIRKNHMVETESDDNGSVAADSSADNGDTLSLKATAKDGYKVDKITVTYKNAEGKDETKDVDLTTQKDGSYSFDLPDDMKADSAISVKASFVEDKDTSAEQKKDEASAEDKKSPASDPENEKKTDKPGITEAVDKATASASGGQAPSVGFAGCIAVNVANNSNLSVIRTAQTVKAAEIAVQAIGTSKVEAIADGSKAKDPEKDENNKDKEPPKTGLGAGVSVNLVDHANIAYILASVESAGDIRVEALSASESEPVTYRAKSLAGFNSGSVGLSGSISVQVASVKNKAMLLNGSDLKLDGALIVTSNSYEKIKVAANAAGKGGDGVGVGAGICADIFGADVLAVVDDGVVINPLNEAAVGELAVTSEHKLVEEKVEGKAGVDGGKATVPVASVVVSGVDCEAYLGRGNTLQIRGNAEEPHNSVVVSTNSEIAREIVADASAGGFGVGVGAAILVSVLNDTVQSHVNRSMSIRDGNLNVQSSSKNESKALSKAGANGEKPESDGKDSAAGDSGTEDSGTKDAEPPQKPSVDKQADNLLKDAAKLADSTGSNNANSESAGKMSAGRQKAETSEGSVSVAAAFVLNLSKHSNLATLGGGITVTLNKYLGEVTVTALADTDVQAFADGSTTNSKNGVGAAVAINQAKYWNKAFIYDVVLTAHSLTLIADMLESEPDELVIPEDEPNFIAKLVKRQLTGILSELENYSIGNLQLGKDLSTFISNLVTAYLNDALNAVAKEAGIGKGIMSGNVLKIIDERLTDLFGDDTMLLLQLDPEKYPAALADLMQDIVIELANNAVTHLATADQVIEKAVKARFTNNYKSLLREGAVLSVSNDAWDRFDQTLIDRLMEVIASGRLLSSPEFDKLTQSMPAAEKAILSKLDANLVLKSINNAIFYLTSQNSGEIQREDLEAALANYFPRANRDDYVSKDGYLTDDQVNKLEEDLTKNLGKIMDQMLDDLVDVNKLKTFLKEEFADKMKETALGMIQDANKAISGLVIDALTHWVGAAAEPDDPGANNSFATHAVAGAGAANVGVAGSVAIGLIKGNTEAAIGGLNAFRAEDITLDGDLVIRAFSRQIEDTVATSSVTEKGVVERNAEASADADEGSGSEGDKKDDEADQKRFIQLGDAFLGNQYGQNDVKVDSEDAKYKPGEKVTITAKLKDGKTVDLWYKLNNKEYHIDPASKDEKEKEITFIFVMPETSDLIKLEIVMKDKDDGGATGSTNAKGQSVGVGAAFAMVIAENNVKAGIGANRNVEAGSMDIRALSEHNPATASVAGTDPLHADSGNTGEAKKTAIDASVAIAIIDDEVRSYTESGTVLVTTGTDSVYVETPEEEDGEEEDDAEKVNVMIYSETAGASETKASGFAMGEETSVGAAVTVNVLSSTARTIFSGEGRFNGKALIAARSYSEDVSIAMATAMGSNMQKYADYLNGNAYGEKIEKLNALLDGSAFTGWIKSKGEEAKDSSTSTADSVNDKLNEHKTSEDGKEEEKDASAGLPLSTNILRAMDAKTDSKGSSGEANDKALDTVKDNLDASKATGGTSSDASEVLESPAGAQGGENDKKSTQVAAAVALNITNHKAYTLVTGTIYASDITVMGINNGNFLTKGTGAAMNAKKGDSIGVGVGISLNKNAAVAETDGAKLYIIAPVTEGDEASDASETGGVRVESQMTQNMDDGYRGLLAVQAIAGSYAGEPGEDSTSIAFALAILISKAQTVALVGENTQIVDGGDIVVLATDKTKLAVRAGAVSVSTGKSMGAGASFALIYAHNDLTARIGDGSNLTGDSLTVAAIKLPVSKEDFVLAVESVNFITKSDVPLTDDANKGLIHLQKVDGAYQVQTNMSAESLMMIFDLLNYLSSVNYYIEAIAGAVVASTEGKDALSGSFALVFYYNNVEASIGSNVTINVGGDVQVEAESSTNARVIAGAISAGGAKTGGGLTVGVLTNQDRVYATVGTNTKINAGGDFTQSAKTDYDCLVITAAAALTAGSTDGTAVGGAITVIVAKNITEALIFDSEDDAHRTEITAKSISVLADTKQLLTLVSVSAALTTGKTAAGGTLAVTVNNSEANAMVGSRTTLHSLNDVAVKASASDKLYNILISASGSAQGTAVAAVLAVLYSSSAVRAGVGNYVNILADNGGITVLSDSVSKQLMIAPGLALGKGTAAGASFVANVFERNIITVVGSGSSLTCARDILIDAQANEDVFLLGAAVAASANSAAISGVIGIVISQNNVHTYVGNVTADQAIMLDIVRDGQHASAVIAAGNSGVNSQSGTALRADGSVTVNAALNSEQLIIMGGAAATAGNVGVGIVMDTGVFLNDVSAQVGADTTILAKAKTTNRADKRKGIFVHAQGHEKVWQFAVGIAAATGNASVCGVVNTMVVSNKVLAQMHGTAVAGYETEAEGAGEITAEAEVSVSADDDASHIDCAGALSASSNVGVGATIAVLVYNQKVTADASAAKRIRATGDVSVTANAHNDTWLLALAFAAAGTASVAGDVNVMVFRANTEAILGGTVDGRNIAVKADSWNRLINVGAGAAGAGTAAVVGVGIVTYFDSETYARVLDGAALTAKMNISVMATSEEFCTPDAAGLTVAGTAAVSGALDVIISRVTTLAIVGKQATLTAAEGSVNVKAMDTYELLAIVACVGAGGTAGVGVSVLVSVAFNNVKAELGAGSTVTAGADVNVNADSKRTVDTYVVSLTGGGTAAVAPAVAVVVAGARLTKDVVDSMNKCPINAGFVVNLAYGTNPVLKGLKPSGVGTMEDNNTADIDELASDNQSAEGLKPNDGWNEYGQDRNRKPENYGAISNPIDEKDAKNVSEGTGENTNPTAGVNGDDLANLGAGRKDGAQLAGRKDAAQASVATGATVTAGGNITVTANDLLNADIIGGSIAVGGVAGVTVGVAVAVLNSNVAAVVENNAVLSAGKNITVRAATGSESRKNSDKPFDPNSAAGQNRSDADSRIRENDLSGSDSSTIRCISLTLAFGGTAGVGLAVANLFVYSDVATQLNGEVKKAKNVSVCADMNFGEVISVVLAVTGGGVAGVAASVGLVFLEASCEASVGSAAKLGTASPIASLKVLTNGKTNAAVAAASIAGGGGVGVAAGVAIVLNRTVVNTFIAGGAYVNAQNGSVTVNTRFESAAKAFIITVSLGTVSVGATVAFANNSLSTKTYIGAPGETVTALSSILATNVSVTSESTGAMKVLGFGLSAGVVSVNGIIAIGFNRVSSTAAISGANLSNGDTNKTDSVTVNAAADANSSVEISSLAAGSVAVGMAMGIARTDAKVLNLVNVGSGSDMRIKNLRIGGSDCNAQTLLAEVTGSAGSLTFGMNFGLSINNASFTSKLTGAANGSLIADSADLSMNGNAYSHSVIYNASVSGIAAGVSVAVALLQAVQEALVMGSAKMTIGNLNVASTQNLQAPGNIGCIVTVDRGRNEEFKFSKMAQAQIVAFKVALVGVGADVATAVADATCRSKVMAGDLTVNGGLNVSANANTYSSAEITQNSVSAANVGAAVTYSYANGTVEAILGSTKQMKLSGPVNVFVNYNARSEALTHPGMGGVLLNVSVNAAIARIRTKARAGIEGSGSIDAGANSVTVKTVGSVKSNASVTPSKMAKGFKINVFTVGASFVQSVLQAEQTAYVKQAEKITAGTLKVISLYNVSGDQSGNTPVKPTKAEDTGAFARVGASGTEAGLASVKIDLGFAFSSSTVTAKVEDASLKLSGDLIINTLASSYANTTVEKPQFEVNGYEAGVSYVYSYASGTYEAGIDSKSKANAAIKANNAYIWTGCTTESDAVTGPQGGAKVGAVEVNVNIAKSNAKSKANTYIKGSGSASFDGNVLVETLGNIRAKARVTDSDIKITGVSVGSDNVFTNVTANYSAYTDIRGNVTVGGSLTVRSSATGKADSLVGHKDGVAISLIKGGMNVAEATSKLTNKAYLNGSNNGLIKVHGNVTVEAIADTEAKAKALKPLSIALAELAGQIAISNSQDKVEAFIGKENAEAFTLESDGNVNVYAKGDTVSESVCASGPSVSLASFKGGDLKAYIAKGDGNAQTVRAFIGPNTTVRAGGDVKVHALNKGKVTAKMTEGFNISIAGGSSNNVCTDSKYLTEAFVGNGAVVESGGSIVILAEDNPTANATVDGDGVGIICNADKKYSKNNLTQTVNAKIGERANLKAFNNVSVKALSSATVKTRTDASTGGMFAKGSVTARTYVERTVKVAAEAGSEITARYGNLDLIAEGGRSDNIQTVATGSAAGLVGIAGSKASSDITNHVSADVSGAALSAVFGTLNVNANVAEKKAVTNGSYEAAGVAAEPETQAFDNNCEMFAEVRLSGNSKLTASTVNVGAQIREMAILSKTDSHAKGFAGDAKAKSMVELNLNTTVTINGAEIYGYDAVNIFTNATPTSSGYNVKSYAHSKLSAAGGAAISRSTLKGDLKNGVTMSNASVYSYKTSLSSKNFYGNVDCVATSVREGIFIDKDPKRDTSDLNYSDSYFKIENNVTFYLGMPVDVVMDIDEYGNVHTAGSAKKLTSKVDGASKTVTVTGLLIPRGVGSLIAPKVNLHNATIIDERSLVVKGNIYYDGTVILPGFDTNIAAEGGKVVGKNVPSIQRPGADLPVLNLYAHESSDLRFGNVVMNETGTLNIKWLNTPGNLLPSMIGADDPTRNITPVWTHKLNIVNANNIGITYHNYSTGHGERVENDYFQVLMTKVNNEMPTVNVSACGDVYLEPVLAQVVRQNYLTEVTSNDVSGTVKLGTLVTAGIMDLNLTPSIQLHYLPSASGVLAETVNTTACFLTDNEIDGSALISLANLEYYLVSQNETERVYELPNGLQVVTDVNGNVLRIGNDSTEQITNDQGWMILGTDVDDNGDTHYVLFDPTTGVLKVETGYTGTFNISILRDSNGNITNVDSSKVVSWVGVNFQEWKLDEETGKYIWMDGMTLSDLDPATKQTALENLLKAASVRELLNLPKLSADYKNTNEDEQKIAQDLEQIKKDLVQIAGNITVYALNEQQDILMLMRDDRDFLGIAVLTDVWLHEETRNNVTVEVPVSGSEKNYGSESGDVIAARLDKFKIGTSDETVTVYSKVHLYKLPTALEQGKTLKSVSGSSIIRSELTNGDNKLPYFELADHNGTPTYCVSATRSTYLDCGNGQYFVVSAPDEENIEEPSPVGLRYSSDVKPEDRHEIIVQFKSINGRYTISADELSVLVNGNSPAIERKTTGTTVEVVTQYLDGTFDVNGNVRYIPNTGIRLNNVTMKMEQVTDNVARVASGNGYRYFFLVGDTWKEAAVSNNTAYYNGEEKLSWRTENGKLVFTLYAQGKKTYDVYADGHAVSLMPTKKTIDLYDVKSSMPQNYEVGTVKSTGDDVYLWFGPGVNNVLPAQGSNGIVSAGDIYEGFYETSVVNLGADTNRLKYQLGGPDNEVISFIAADDSNRVIRGKQYIVVENGEGDYTFLPDTILKSGSLLDILVKNGNVYAEDLNTEAGSKLVMKVLSQDGTTGGYVRLTGDTVFNGEVRIHSVNDITIDHLATGSDSVVTMKAISLDGMSGGNVWMGEDSVIAGEAYVYAVGNIAAMNLTTTEGSTLVMEALSQDGETGGQIPLEGDTVFDGKVRIHAVGGNVVLERGTFGPKSDVWICAEEFTAPTNVSMLLSLRLPIHTESGNVIVTQYLDASGILNITADIDIDVQQLLKLKEGADVNLLTYKGKLYVTELIAEGCVLNGIICGDIIIDEQKYASDEQNIPVKASNNAVIDLTSTSGSLIAVTTDKEEDYRIWNVSDGASVTVRTYGDLIVPTLNAVNAKAVLESTGANLYFDRVNGYRADVTLAANNNIDYYHDRFRGEETYSNHATITFTDKAYEADRFIDGSITPADEEDTDDNAKLTLRAGGNIGSKDRWLYVDVPGAVTPVIELVDSFYIDAQDQSILPWDLYQYWVTSGHGIEQVNVSFDKELATDYLSYSDVQFFLSLLDIDDNDDLAQWITVRADDVHGSKNAAFKNYVDVDQIAAWLLEKDNIDITEADLTRLISVDLLGSKDLAAFIRNEMKEAKKADAAYDALGTFTTAFENAIFGLDPISDEEAIKVLSALLDGDKVTRNGSVTDLVNYLFKNSSYYSSDYRTLLDAAIDSSEAYKGQIQNQKEQNADALSAAKADHQDKLTARCEALNALYETITDSLKIRTSSVDALRRQAADESALQALLASKALPTAADYNAVYTALRDALIDSTPATTEQLTKLLSGFEADFSDFKLNRTASASAAALLSAAKQYQNAIEAEQKAAEEVLRLAKADRALTQRAAELGDSYTNSLSAAQIAQQLDDILNDRDGTGSKWDKALAEQSAAQKALDTALADYELLLASFAGISDIHKDNTANKNAANAIDEQNRKLLADAAQRVSDAQAHLDAADANVAALYTKVYELINTHVDQPVRDFNLVIGEIYGSANLYNTGDISITVDPDQAPTTVYQHVLDRAADGEITLNDDHSTDIVVSNVRSEMGSVSITNKGGSILSADPTANKDQEWIYRNDGVSYCYDAENNTWTQVALDGTVSPFTPDVWSKFAESMFATGTDERYQKQVSKRFENVNIYCTDLTLDAYGSIGSAETQLQTQTRDEMPVKVANASTNMDPFGIGAYERFDDLEVMIYDGNLNLLKNALESGIDSCLVSSDLYDQRVINKDGSFTFLPTGNKDPLVVELIEVEWTRPDGTTYRTWGLEVSVRHDWYRTEDLTDTAHVDAVSRNGSIYMAEYEGSVEAGSISAKNDLVYTVPGSIYDGRTQEQKDNLTPNIQAGGNAVVTVSGDNTPANTVVDTSVSADPDAGQTGTAEDRLLVQVGSYDAQGNRSGELTLTNQDSIYLEVLDELILNGNCTDSHYEIDVLSQAGGVVLRDLNPDTEVLTGYINSKGGVAVETVGDIGTAEEPFHISNEVGYTGSFTDSEGAQHTFEDVKKYGTVSFDGNNVYLDASQADGTPNDLVLAESTAKGDLVMNVTGTVYDASDSKFGQQLQDLLDKQQAYDAAKNELAKAEALLVSTTNNDAAVRLAEAQAAMEDALNNTASKEALMKDAKDALAQSQKDYAALIAAGNVSDTARDDAITQLAKAEERLALATEDLKNAQAEAAVKEQLLKDAQADFDITQDVSQDVIDYAKAQVAEAQKKLDTAETQLKDTKAMIDAQYRLTEEQRNADQAAAAAESAKAAAENAPSDANAQAAADQAQKQAQIAANVLEAVRYLESARAYLVKLEDENASEAELAIARKLVEEAEQVVKLVDRAAAYTDTNDAAFAAQAGIGDQDTELEILEKIAKQQQIAIDLLKAVDRLAAAEETADTGRIDQANTTLAAVKELVNSADQAYTEQAEMLKREQDLSDAVAEQDAA